MGRIGWGVPSTTTSMGPSNGSLKMQKTSTGQPVLLPKTRAEPDRFSYDYMAKIKGSPPSGTSSMSQWFCEAGHKSRWIGSRQSQIRGIVE